MAVGRSLLLRGGREFGVEGEQLGRGAVGDERCLYQLSYWQEATFV
jgi:hypothetical protein